MSEGRPRLPTATREELTPRQREVMRLMAAGRTNFEIAQHLGVSLEGAKYHVSEILGKLGVDSREDAVAAWRHEQRPLVRFRRALAPIAAASWLRPALALGVLVLALGIGILLVLLATSGDSDPDDDPVPAVTDPDPTATPFPPDNVPASCAADRARIVHPAWGPAAGDGPVYASFGPPMEPGQRTLTYYPSGRFNSFPEGWGGREIMVIVEDTYQDAITISATRLDGQTPVQILGESEFILLPLSGGPEGFPPISVTADGWRNYLPPIQMPLDATGCYALDFTGPGLSERVTFWAELDPAGRTVVASEPPVCGPPPPILKPPTDGPGYLRVAGRTYLSGVAFQAPGPTLSVDPSLVGREIGRVKWNIDDPDIDFCHADLDGASSALVPGTSIHAHDGYREDFRVVAETPYGWRIFESDWRDGADTADDLIDIRGKVVSLHAEKRQGQAVMASWAVLGSGDVVAIVDRLLDEPISFSGDIPLFGEPQLLFTFQLDDATQVSRFWFAGPQPYSSGIPVSEAFLDEITTLLEQSQ
jgi:DNA-binding CsgD family transcriptional regulator